MRNPRPTPLERAAGLVWGADPAASPLPEVPAELTPRLAVEEIVRESLLRPPCRVSFSGGVDSSILLAIAVRVARRDSLPEPVPVTKRYQDAPASEESRLQEVVIEHLGIDTWDRRVFASGELDLVGPWSTRAVSRFGLLWPPLVYMQLPLIEHSAGGSLITGLGGDQVMGSWQRARAAWVFSGGERPRVRELGALARAGAPRAVRRAQFRKAAPAWAWLRPDARREAVAAWAREEAGQPLWWSAKTAWSASRLDLALQRESLDLMANAAGTSIRHPFMDPRYPAALARRFGRRGMGDRIGVVWNEFHDLLPREVLQRPDKASFDEALFGPHLREFATTWDGVAGIDLELVDPDALRRQWRQAAPWGVLSAGLAQAAWLASASGEREQPVDRGADRPPAPGTP